MKCQKCDKVATFHITEMTDAQPKELHLCDQHAYEYLHRSDAQRSQDTEERREPNEEELELDPCDEIDDEDLAVDLEAATSDLAEEDLQPCPCCEIGFQDFRKTGKFGCANDYRVFRSRLEPLLLGIHGATEHRGKRPSRASSIDDGATLVRLRNEMLDAIKIEDYERAGALRDKIAELEKKLGVDARE